MSPPRAGEPEKAPEPLLRPGQLLGGRYEIERCLGGGGMASVYRAKHVGLEQPVAVKVVSPLIRELPGVVSRFMREARAATRLKGEHVVRVFDVGTTDDGAPYLVMELLEGRDLAERIDEGLTPDVDEAVDYVLQACEALAEVHGLGIVHRDLKPANLFVTHGPDGLVCIKLIDFGISRVDSPLSPKDAIALTNPDVVMGSPRYMPPEQMESAAAADSRSDIWGLGAILYELLVGKPPFEGESLLDIYAAAVQSPPVAPSELRSDIPKELDAVVLKCLRVDPDDRHVDVAELAFALSAAVGSENAAARAESIARVLDASRLRGRGGDDPRVDSRDDANGSSSTSRIRRRASSASRTSRRKKAVGYSVAAIALVGLGALAMPLARRLEVGPFVANLAASAAAGTGATATGANGASASATLTSEATPSPAVSDSATPASTLAAAGSAGATGHGAEAEAEADGVGAAVTVTSGTSGATDDSALIAAVTDLPEPALPNLAGSASAGAAVAVAGASSSSSGVGGPASADKAAARPAAPSRRAPQRWVPPARRPAAAAPPVDESSKAAPEPAAPAAPDPAPQPLRAQPARDDRTLFEERK